MRDSHLSDSGHAAFRSDLSGVRKRRLSHCVYAVVISQGDSTPLLGLRIYMATSGLILVFIP